MGTVVFWLLAPCCGIWRCCCKGMLSWLMEWRFHCHLRPSSFSSEDGGNTFLDNTAVSRWLWLAVKVGNTFYCSPNNIHYLSQTELILYIEQFDWPSLEIFHVTSTESLIQECSVWIVYLVCVVTLAGSDVHFIAQHCSLNIHGLLL